MITTFYVHKGLFLNNCFCDDFVNGSSNTGSTNLHVAGDFDISVAAAVVLTPTSFGAEAKGTYAGCWGLPKGHVEPNESIENGTA